jgi:hypothetical protein
MFLNLNEKVDSYEPTETMDSNIKGLWYRSLVANIPANVTEYKILTADDIYKITGVRYATANDVSVWVSMGQQDSDLTASMVFHPYNVNSTIPTGDWYLQFNRNVGSLAGVRRFNLLIVASKDPDTTVNVEGVNYDKVNK